MASKTPNISPRMQARMDALDAQAKGMPSGDELEGSGVVPVEGAAATTTPVEPVVATPAAVAEPVQATTLAVAAKPAEQDWERLYREETAKAERATAEAVTAAQAAEDLRQSTGKRIAELEATIAPLTAAQQKLKDIEEAQAMSLDESDILALGGEEAVNAAAKLAAKAAAQARKEMGAEFSKLLDERLGALDERVETGVKKVNAKSAEADTNLRFSNAVFSTESAWNSLTAPNSDFQKFLDADQYGRRAVVNAIFSNKDSSPEAMKKISALVTEFRGGKTASTVSKDEFAAPAAVQGTPKSTASSAAGDEKPDLRKLSALLRSGKIAEAQKYRAQFT